jgi:hypothetical protein
MKAKRFVVGVGISRSSGEIAVEWSGYPRDKGEFLHMKATKRLITHFYLVGLEDE